MRELATEDIAEDLCIAMRMCWETLSTIDSVLVQDSQRTEVLEFGVVIVCERKGVVGIQPAMVRMSSVVGAARYNLCVGESFGHG